MNIFLKAFEDDFYLRNVKVHDNIEGISVSGFVGLGNYLF